MKRANRWQKQLDYWVGIPLIWIGYLFRSIHKLGNKRNSPHSPESLAIFCIAAIGDLLLLSASIQEFQKSFPACRLTLFCGPDNKSLIPLIDPEMKIFKEVHVLAPKNFLQNIRLLRKNSFDVIIDSGQWARWSALMSALTPAGFRIGFKTRGQFRHLLFDESVEHRNQVHEIENYHQLFANWLKSFAQSPHLKRGRFESSLSPYAVCHLFPSGAGSYQKEWPAHNWIELFCELKKLGYNILLTGASGDRARLNQLFTNSDLDGLCDLVGKTSLTETRDVLADADLVISVNTGIMHLAAAVEAPLVALHGPTNPKRWGPVSKNNIVVQSDLGCSPCLNLGFDYGCPRNDCMKNITPAKVLNAIREIRKDTI